MTTPLIHDGLRLVATRSAINCAGLFVVSTLTKWGVRSILVDSVRVTEELVTAAVRATGIMEQPVRWTEVTRVEYITVRLLGFEASIRIEVWDTAPNPPFLPNDADSYIKRGFYHVARGKVVWAELWVLPRHRQPTQAPPPAAPPPEQFAQDPGVLRRVRDGLEGL